MGRARGGKLSTSKENKVIYIELPPGMCPLSTPIESMKEETRVVMVLLGRQEIYSFCKTASIKWSLGPRASGGPVRRADNHAGGKEEGKGGETSDCPRPKC